MYSVYGRLAVRFTGRFPVRFTVRFPVRFTVRFTGRFTVWITVGLRSVYGRFTVGHQFSKFLHHICRQLSRLEDHSKYVPNNNRMSQKVPKSDTKCHQKCTKRHPKRIQRASKGHQIGTKTCQGLPKWCPGAKVQILGRFWSYFGSHFGMVFPWFYHKVSILFLHWFSEPFFIILFDFWWKVEPKWFPKSYQNRSRICTFAPGHHLGRPWHVLVLIWCPFDAFWMTLVFVFPASVFRLFTHQTRHLVLSFNMENDQRIKAHLLRWFPAIL